ncbi:MAG: M14 family zinc carboxypeptidase [Candidatus Sericytochromatia bacterium]
MKLNKSLMVLVSGLLVMSACTSNSSNQIDVPQVTEQINASSVRGEKVVEIKLKKTRDDLINLSTKGFDLFGFNNGSKTVRARVSQDEEKSLKDLSLTYKVMPEKNMSAKGVLPGYMTYSEMVTKLKALAQANPKIASLNDIGDTWEKTQGKAPNNDIWCMTITNKDKNKSAKPASMFIGGMHARELAPPEIMFKLAETLITNYGKDAAITELVDTRDINIIPMVNVDGRIQVEKGNNWQRKNTHGSGVDLNRNFDSHWNYQGLNVPSSWIGGDASPSSETYSGPSAASEPEVQAVQNFYNTKKLNMVLDMHSYGEMFFWPVGYSDKDIPEVALFKDMYNSSFKNIGYQGGTSMSLLYPTTGTTDDYAYVKHKALGLGMEIGQSFRPTYQEVEGMWSKLKPNLLYLLKKSNTNLSK